MSGAQRQWRITKRKIRGRVETGRIGTRPARYLETLYLSCLSPSGCQSDLMYIHDAENRLSMAMENNFLTRRFVNPRRVAIRRKCRCVAILCTLVECDSISWNVAPAIAFIWHYIYCSAGKSYCPIKSFVDPEKDSQIESSSTLLTSNSVSAPAGVMTF